MPWQPRWLKWSVAISRKGAFTRDGIPTTQALTEDVAAALPGAPMAIPSPGHTGGHCSFVVDGVLVSGDALVTGHPTATRTGPQLLHKVFNHDQDGCVRSLAALAMLETDVLVPGHGQVWRGPIREAATAGDAGVRPAPRSRAGRSRSGTGRSTRRTSASGSCRRGRRRPNVAPPAKKGPQPESGGKRHTGCGKEQPPYGRLRNLHPTTPPPLRATAPDSAYRQR